MKCPHCLENFHERWKYESLENAASRSVWGMGIAYCPACNKCTITLGKVILTAGVGANSVVLGCVDGTHHMVYPKAISRIALPKDVPEKFSNDYSEACLVLPDSEKASAALSRRCLQNLLREHVRVKKQDLSKEIQEVIDSKQLPSYIASDLDAIRNIGNFATHPLKSTNTGEVVDVEPTEAEWLLNLLEALFDFYFVQPALAQARRDALNNKLNAMGKPPMKQ